MDKGLKKAITQRNDCSTETYEAAMSYLKHNSGYGCMEAYLLYSTHPDLPDGYAWSYEDWLKDWAST